MELRIKFSPSINSITGRRNRRSVLVIYFLGKYLVSVCGCQLTVGCSNNDFNSARQFTPSSQLYRLSIISRPNRMVNSKSEMGNLRVLFYFMA